MATSSAACARRVRERKRGWRRGIKRTYTKGDKFEGGWREKKHSDNGGPRRGIVAREREVEKQGEGDSKRRTPPTYV